MKIHFIGTENIASRASVIFVYHTNELIMVSEASFFALDLIKVNYRSKTVVIQKGFWNWTSKGGLLESQYLDTTLSGGKNREYDRNRFQCCFGCYSTTFCVKNTNNRNLDVIRFVFNWDVWQPVLSKPWFVTLFSVLSWRLFSHSWLVSNCSVV